MFDLVKDSLLTQCPNCKSTNISVLNNLHDNKQCGLMLIDRTNPNDLKPLLNTFIPVNAYVCKDCSYVFLNYCSIKKPEDLTE